MSGESVPLVSIIMNCRNSAAYLREAIDSIYAQSYASWEIIFWDNASTDGSADIARSYDGRLRYFRSEAPATLGQARNLAMQEVGGEYLCFLDCDDRWAPLKLEKQVRALAVRQDVDFLYSNYFRLIMPRTDRLVLGLKGAQPAGHVFGRFLRHYPVNLQTVMLRVGVLRASGLQFDEQFEVSEEFDLFMRMLFSSCAHYIDEPLATYRIHGAMSSQKLLYKYPVEMARILEKLKGLEASVTRVYASEIKYYEAKLAYWRAKVDMDRGDDRAARARLAVFKFTDMKFLVLYVLTWLPPGAWKWVHARRLGLSSSC